MVQESWITSSLGLLQSNHPSKVNPIDMLCVLSPQLCTLMVQPRIFQFHRHIALSAAIHKKTIGMSYGILAEWIRKWRKKLILFGVHTRTASKQLFSTQHRCFKQTIVPQSKQIEHSLGMLLQFEHTFSW